MSETPSKTHTSFLRRLLVAYLIDSGSNTVSLIIEATGMPRRTAQDTVKALIEIEVQVDQPIRGQYQVIDWGAVKKDWIEQNINHICFTLGYPAISTTALNKSSLGS